MKKQIVFFNTISIILLNIIFWVCNYYPRHLFEFGSVNTVIATILNFIYFIGYFFVLYIFFVKNKTFFSENIFNTFQPFKEQIDIKKMVILLVSQIVLELLRINISAFVKEFYCILIDTFTVISWIIVYFILTIKCDNFIKSKKIILLVTVVIFFAFSASIIFDIKMILGYQAVMQKYELSSEYVIQTAKNLDFEHSIRNLVLDSFLGFIFILFHSLKKAKVDEHIKRNDLKKFNLFSISNFICVNGIKIMVLLLATLPIMALKIFICRDSVIKTVGLPSTEIIEECITAQSNCIEISRMAGYRNEKNVYNKVTTKIYSGDTKLAEIYSIEREILKTRYINDTEVNTAYNAIVLVKENDVVKATEFDNIYKCDENEILTEVLRQLISEGNVIAFEYGMDYLIKYDKTFIEPYISRYASMDFSSQEQGFFDKTGYKKEYIVNIAKQSVIKNT